MSTAAAFFERLHPQGFGDVGDGFREVHALYAVPLT